MLLVNVLFIILVGLVVGIMVLLSLRLKEKFAQSDLITRDSKEEMFNIWKAHHCDPLLFEGQFEKRIDNYIKNKKTLNDWENDVKSWVERKWFQCGLDQAFKIRTEEWQELQSMGISLTLSDNSEGNKQLGMFFNPSDVELSTQDEKSPLWEWRVGNGIILWNRVMGSRSIRELLETMKQFKNVFGVNEQCYNEKVAAYLVNTYKNSSLRQIGSIAMGNCNVDPKFSELSGGKGGSLDVIIIDDKPGMLKPRL